MKLVLLFKKIFIHFKIESETDVRLVLPNFRDLLGILSCGWNLSTTYHLYIYR